MVGVDLMNIIIFVNNDNDKNLNWLLKRDLRVDVLVDKIIGFCNN